MKTNLPTISYPINPIINNTTPGTNEHPAKTRSKNGHEINQYEPSKSKTSVSVVVIEYVVVIDVILYRTKKFNFMNLATIRHQSRNLLRDFY